MKLTLLLASLLLAQSEPQGVRESVLQAPTKQELPKKPKAIPDAVVLDVTGPGVKTVIVVDELPAIVSASPPGALLYNWSVPAGVEATDMGDKLEITKAPHGQVVVGIKATFVDWEAKSSQTRFARVTVSVGGVIPVPPTPPTPGPSPEPSPTPNPIPGNGRAVMLVVGEDLTAIPQSQQAILWGTAFRDFLTSKVGTDALPNGKQQASWRLWKKGTDASGDVKWTQDAMKVPVPETPWIIISNGANGTSQKLPMTDAEAKALVNKYLP